MSKIGFTKKDLEDVASLSRLHLKEEEKEKFLIQMKEVLEYVGKVSEIANENVENSGGINYSKQFENSVNKNIMREDIVLNEANNNTEDLLNDAPTREGNFVRVSQVLDKHKK